MRLSGSSGGSDNGNDDNDGPRSRPSVARMPRGLRSCKTWPYLLAHPRGLPFPSLCAHEGCLGLGCMPMGGCLGLSSVPLAHERLPLPWQHAHGVTLALAACLWGFPWPQLHALALPACPPMGATLPFAVCPLGLPWPWLHALALAVCLLPIRGCLSLGSMLWPWLHAHGGLPWPWLHAHRGAALALASCLLPMRGCVSLGGMPWPWQHAHGGYLGLGCML
nr:hypothetical protein CFP56_66361 [Quercus suber]